MGNVNYTALFVSAYFLYFVRNGTLKSWALTPHKITIRHMRVNSDLHIPSPNTINPRIFIISVGLSPSYIFRNKRHIFMTIRINGML